MSTSGCKATQCGPVAFSLPVGYLPQGSPGWADHDHRIFVLPGSTMDFKGPCCWQVPQSVVQAKTQRTCDQANGPTRLSHRTLWHQRRSRHCLCQILSSVEFLQTDVTDLSAGQDWPFLSEKFSVTLLSTKVQPTHRVLSSPASHHNGAKALPGPCLHTRPGKCEDGQYLASGGESSP